MENQEISQTLRNEELTQAKVYSFRWFIAVLVAILLIILRLIKYSFGIVNNVYVSYFNLTYVEVDWFTLSQVPADIFCCVVLAFVIYTKRSGFRSQLLLMTGCEIVTCICLVCAYAFPALYPLMYISQVFIGFASALCATATTTFAINWFPKSEIGTALSIRSTSLAIGSLLGYIAPSHIFVSPNTNSTNTTSTTEEIGEDWFRDSKRQFLLFSIPLLAVCVLVFIVELLFVGEHPPQPPNVGSESNQREKCKKQVSFQTAKQFVYEITNIIRIKTQILVGIVLAIRRGILYTMVLFWAEMMREIYFNEENPSYSNDLSSYVLVVFEVGYAIGSFACGLVYDKYKKPTLQINLSNFVVLFALVGLLLSYFFISFVLMMCFSVLFGLMFGISISVYFSVLFQHINTGNEALVTILIKLESYLGILIFGVSTRYVLDSFGGIGVFVFTIALWLLLIVLSWFVKPAVIENNDDNYENTALVRNDDNNRDSSLEGTHDIFQSTAYSHNDNENVLEQNG